MNDIRIRVNDGCAHIDLENYICNCLEEGELPTGPFCRECLAGLYSLWKESIWEQAKERNGRLFPYFGTHGKAGETHQ
jgi:hypothetical protein